MTTVFAPHSPPASSICYCFLLFTIYNSIYNFHSLLIQCFMGPAIVSDAAFTKAISIILKTNSLHRRLVWSLVCFGPLRPDLDRFCAPTPRSIMPVHLHRSWIRPFQQEFRPPPPPHVPKNSWEEFRLLHPKVTSCHRGLNATVGAHLPQGKQTACRRRDPRTCTRHHAEVWEVTNYPLCECVFREAVRRHTVQTGRDTKLIAMLSLLRKL